MSQGIRHAKGFSLCAPCWRWARARRTRRFLAREGATTIDDRTSLAFAQPPRTSPSMRPRAPRGDAAFGAVFVRARLGAAGVRAAVRQQLVQRLPPAQRPWHAGDGHLPSARSCSVRVSLPEGTLNHPNGAVPVPGLGLQIRGSGRLRRHARGLRHPVLGGELGHVRDGTAYGLRTPAHPHRPSSDGSALPSEMLTSLRLPPPVLGLGLLEARGGLHPARGRIQTIATAMASPAASTRSGTSRRQRWPRAASA